MFLHKLVHGCSFLLQRKDNCMLSQITVVGFIKLLLFVVLLQHSFKNQTFTMNTTYLYTKHTNRQTKTRVYYLKNSCCSTFLDTWDLYTAVLFHMYKNILCYVKCRKIERLLLPIVFLVQCSLILTTRL